MTETPKELDWVSVRASCTLLEIFKSLESGVKGDVEAVKSLPGFPGATLYFHPTSGRTFSVTRAMEAGIPIGDTVTFSLEKDAIHVHWRDAISNTQMFTATVTVDNDGSCKLRIGDHNLEQWQVRRMALEKLLFGS